MHTFMGVNPIKHSGTYFWVNMQRPLLHKIYFSRTVELLNLCLEDYSISANVEELPQLPCFSADRKRNAKEKGSSIPVFLKFHFYIEGMLLYGRRFSFVSPHLQWEVVSV